jgi:hypothetical protein
MATKKQIAEQAMRILSGGHLKPDRTLDIRELMLHLDQLRDKAVQDYIYNSVNRGDYHVDDSFLSFYESLSVETPGANGLAYVDLPAEPIALPNGMGIYQVSPVDDMEQVFIVCSPGQMAIYASSDALEQDGKTFCWAVDQKLYLKNNSESAVTILMVASSKDIAETATYPVPPDMEKSLLQELVQMFGVMQQLPHDEAEDGQK